jgi:hypothetical protein
LFVACVICRPVLSEDLCYYRPWVFCRPVLYAACDVSRLVLFVACVVQYAGLCCLWPVCYLQPSVVCKNGLLGAVLFTVYCLQAYDICRIVLLQAWVICRTVLFAGSLFAGLCCLQVCVVCGPCCMQRVLFVACYVCSPASFARSCVICGLFCLWPGYVPKPMLFMACVVSILCCL